MDRCPLLRMLSSSTARFTGAAETWDDRGLCLYYILLRPTLNTPQKESAIWVGKARPKSTLRPLKLEA